MPSGQKPAYSSATRPSQSQRGVSAIVFMMLALTAMLLMVSAIGNLANHRLNAVARDAYDTRARYAAYAGIQFGLLQLTLNPEYAPSEPVISALPGDEQSFFELTVLNNYNGAPGTSITSPSGVEVPAGSVAFESKGTSVRGSEATSFGVKTMAFRGDRTMRYAILAEEDIRLAASQTDAFRSYRISDTGTLTYHPYDPNLAPESSPGAPGQGHGSLRTNSIEPGALVLQSSSVKGFLIVGPLGDPTRVVLNDGATLDPEYTTPIVGESLRRVARYRPPMNPNAATEEVVVSGTMTLAPGAYRRVVVQPGATLNLTGDYYMITGELVVDGGSINVSPNGSDSDPQLLEPAVVCVSDGVRFVNGAQINRSGPGALPFHLQLVGVGDGSPNGGQEFQMSGSEANCVVVGNTLDVRLSNSRVCGAIKCRSADVQGSSVHFDRALANLGTHHYGLTAWSLSSVVEDQVEVEAGGGGAAAAAAAAAVTGGDAAAAAAAGDAAAAAVGDAAGDAAVGGDAAVAGDAVGDAAAGGDAAAAAGFSGDGDGDALSGDAAASGDGDGDAAS